MQIDWISAFTATPPELWPGYCSGEWFKVGPDGDVLKRGRVLHTVEDEEPSSSRNFTVWTPSPGSLYISGNPVKLLQGHNAWGSLDLVGCYLESGLFVRRGGLFPGPETWKACKFSFPRFSRIDITRSYRFDSDAEALDYIRFVVGTARSRHGAATLQDGGTAYFGKHSRRWTLKVYAKRPEMLHERGRLARRLKARILGDDLVDWATGVVRFELTLRSPELKNVLSGQWHDPALLESLWHCYFDHITWNENAVMTTQSDLVEAGLPSELRKTLALWRAGADLRALSSRATFYRHRGQLLQQLGVDIASPPVASGEARSRVALDPARWDPAPLPGGLVEPRSEVKEQYGLLPLGARV